jgi:selenocysteine lyase/cysteine desulfurase
MDASALRSRFPVLDRTAYLNAGSCGPIPAEAVIAARGALAAALHEGRVLAHFQARLAIQEELRAGYARVLGCEVTEVAVTTSASEGLGKVLDGLGLAPGDEIVTSDEEHPGLLGPLIAARAAGVVVRVAPFAAMAEAVGPRTKAIACSHVSWVTGAVAPLAALVATGVPVILDGAQGAGAIPTDVRALGVAAYAAAGQKWLCGADGSGCLYVSPALGLRVAGPAYANLADPDSGLDAELRPDASRLDTPVISRETGALSLASLRVLEGFGLAAVQARGIALAAQLADRLRERGRTVAARGDTTLVSWEEPDPQAAVERCAQAGVAIRNLPGLPYARASVGGWNDEGDLERLLEAIG